MSRSTRLILMGFLLLLLVAVRMATASSSPEAGVGQGDLDADQFLQTQTAQAFTATILSPTPSPSPTVPVITSTVFFTPAPEASATSRPTISTPTLSPSRTSGPPAANREQPDGFLAREETQRTISPDTAGVPARIAIPAIGLDAPVSKAKYRKILLQGDVFDQWVAPDQFAAGWIATSAFLGESGNTVLIGHHNDFGEVFGRLIDVNVGDSIILFSYSTSRAYRVVNKMVLQELDVPVSQRIQNARWIGRSNDERLTLVTCWPKDTNTHRLIIVASPN